jgi:hypothetical protein
MKTPVFASLATTATLLASTALAQMQYPLSVAAADAEVFFVADRNLPGVWKIEAGKLHLYFEGSTRYRTPLNAVRCLAIDGSGALLAGDSSTREVYRFGDDAQPMPLTDGGIGIPMSIAVDRQGQLLVADLELHRIWKVAAGGGKPELFAEVPAPRGVCIDTEDRLWVVSHGKDQLIRLDAAGKSETVVAGRPFQFPHNVVVGQDGAAYVTDGYAKAVWKVPPDGKPEKLVSGPPLVNPVGLAWRGDKLLVADPQANAIFELTTDGKLARLEVQAAD